jgi:hypothetical protein
MPEVAVAPDEPVVAVHADAAETAAVELRQPVRRLLKAVARCGVKAIRGGGRVVKAAIGRERRASRRGN